MKIVENKFITAGEIEKLLKDLMEHNYKCESEFVPIMSDENVKYRLSIYQIGYLEKRDLEYSNYKKLKNYILDCLNSAIYKLSDSPTLYNLGYRDMAGEVQEYIEKELSNE